MKKLCTLILALLTTILVNAQQTTFSKVYYDVAGNEQAYDVVPTFDHNYLVAGERDQNGLVMKIDPAGTLLWSKKIGTDDNTQFSRIIATSDSNYVMLGYCKNSTLFNKDVFCVKINSAGDTLWSKAFDMGADEYAKSIQQTYDKGFIISGIRDQSVVTPYTFMFVIKLDAAGNLVWAKEISTANYQNQAFAIRQLPDSGYMMTGYIQQQVGSTYVGNACLIRLSPAGNITWAKSIGPDLAYGYDLRVTHDGVMCYLNFQTTYAEVFMKADFNGNIIWSKSFSLFGSSGQYAEPTPQFNATPDGGFMFSAGWAFGPSELYKIDSLGTPLWSKQIMAVATYGIETPDSGVLVLGNGPVYGVKTYPTYNPQIGILTIDSSGNSVSPCMYDGGLNSANVNLFSTAISCSTAVAGTLVAMHPVLANITLDSYDGCVAFLGSVEENQAENSVTAYPNPNPGVFTLQMKKQMDDYSVTLTDITGRKVFERSATHNAHDLIDISAQPNGIYYLTVIDGTKQCRTKVVLLK